MSKMGIEDFSIFLFALHAIAMTSSWGNFLSSASIIPFLERCESEKGLMINSRCVSKSPQKIFCKHSKNCSEIEEICSMLFLYQILNARQLEKNFADIAHDPQTMSRIWIVEGNNFYVIIKIRKWAKGGIRRRKEKIFVNLNFKWFSTGRSE